MIYLGSDHAGYKLKETLKVYLEKLGHHVVDMGADEYNPKDDYPDFITPVALKVALHTGSQGIILGYSGQGEAMNANRIKGVRATVYYGSSMDIIKLSRQHNDSNILSLGAGFLTPTQAKKAVKLWLETKFSGHERHIRRLKKIDKQ